MDGFHARLLETPLFWEDGYIIPPTAPGLGVSLNMDVVIASLWDGDQLHLEMGQNPMIRCAMAILLVVRVALRRMLVIA